MTAVHLRSLGECLIETDEVRLGPDSKYVFAAGLYLVLERGKQVPRETLVDLLWPDVENAGHAKHRLRQVLLRLKQCGVPIVTQRAHITLPRDAADTDFDRVLEANGDAWARLRERQSYEFLPGYGARLSHAFATWMEMHRARVQTSIQRVIAQALHAARARGDWPEVERIAIECMRLDPYHEEATMARAEAAVMRGSKMQALAILDAYMEALGEKSVTIGLPAKLLRSRIAERINQPRYAALSERHFVGREAEMEQLTQLVDEARRGRGGGCLIWGDPGIGKSRLLQEISNVAEMKGVKVVTARCRSTDASRPLSVFADVIPVLRALPGALGVSPQTISVLQRLTQPDDDVAHSGPSDITDAQLLAAATRSAIFDLIDAIAEEVPLFLAVEDAQWLDSTSWSVLRSLIEWGAVHRLTVAMTSRVRDPSALGRDGLDRSFRRLHLTALTPEASASFLSILAEEHAATPPAEMASWCVSVAEGNPYFLRELIIHWIEREQLYGVPQSLADLIARRIDGLCAPTLRLLQAAVMLGSRCTYERLERVAATSAAELLIGIQELAEAGMVVTRGVFLDAKHDLLSQAALNRLTPPAQQLLHRQVGKVLEQELREQKVAALLWDCAHHWLAAGDVPRAVRLLDECARQLLRFGLPEEAINLYERGLKLEDLANDDRRPLYDGLVYALRVAGRWQNVGKLLKEIAELSTTLGEAQGSHSDLELIEIEVRWRTHSATEEDLKRLRRCVTDHESDIRHRLDAAYWLLALSHNLGRDEHAQGIWAYIEPLLCHSELDAAMRFMVAMVYHTDHGDLDQAVAFAHKLVEASRGSADITTLVRALRNGAAALHRAGREADGKAYVHEAYEIAAHYRVAALAADTAELIADTLLDEGHLTEAATWVTTAEEWMRQCQTPTSELELIKTAAILAYLAGDLTRCRELTDRLSEAGLANTVNVRERQTLASLRVALQCRTCPHSVDPRDIRACEEAYAIIGKASQQDFAVYALACGYLVLGETTKARAVVSDFLSIGRQDRDRMLPPLRELAEEIGAS